MVPRGPGELGDEDAVGVRSGTMILTHLDRIELAHGNSKSASSSPDQSLVTDGGLGPVTAIADSSVLAEPDLGSMFDPVADLIWCRPDPAN